MTHAARFAVLFYLSLIAVVGCADDGKPKAVDHQLPAPKQPPAPPAVRNDPIDPELQKAARAQLDSGLQSNDAFIRMHAIEALQQTVGSQAKAIYIKGLSDPEIQVRMASAMSIGQLRIADAKDDLLRMLNDPSRQVGIAVRFALHRLGDKRFSKELETTAQDRLTWQLRAQTAFVLGQLNEPTATRILKPMQRDSEPAVRIQASEALWRLGEPDGLRNLVSASESGYPDDQMVAVLGLAAPKDRRVMGHLRSSLTADYPEVCVVAARAMGMLGSDAGYAIAADAARSKDVNQRSRAALALGAIGRSDAQPLLAELLKDKESPDVRLSAATAILQLKSPAATARGD